LPLLWPLLLAACFRRSLPTEDPAAVVQQFFAAIAAGDCARVRASLGAPYRQEDRHLPLGGLLQ
jgi:hypothetical protein